MTKKKLIWSIVVVVTLVLIFTVGNFIYQVNNEYAPETGQLATNAAVTKYLKTYHQTHPVPSNIKVYYIPTGLFIESFRFTSAYNLDLSGYVWQKFPKNMIKEISPGIVFPESTNLKMSLAFERDQGDYVTMGWYFEGGFTQYFDYRKYPLDHKVVHIRLWPKDFDRDIILIPDLNSYHSTLPTDKFGIDSEAVLQDYDILETFFIYKQTSYDTNFGIKDYVGEQDFPELYYNVVLKRNVLSVFVTNLLPLLAVLVLAFCMLVLMTSDDERRKEHGISLASVASVTSGLLFIVLLSHIRLRETIPSGHIIYLEYIYLVIYFALIYFIIFGFIIMKIKPRNKFMYALASDDYLLPKTFFLPIIFTIILLITLLVL